MSTKRIAGAEIEKLIQLLAKVPGLGPRSARRAALHMIKKKDQLLTPLAGAMADAAEKVQICSVCANVDTQNPCSICTDPRRDSTTIIVVEDVADLWALERASEMSVSYHILGGTLSPLDGVGPDDLNIKTLVDRVVGGEVKELILAVNATVEGQTTAHYITSQLEDLNVKITRLAHGVPVGGELDYLDEGTLSAALRSRTNF
ncbi:recombination mediator RecR [Ahrensia marina]|uniref:Recombination protein RecR n=1 Tax=Ahrensia marina TaxID=1514904 RepID=A0A0N0E6Y5_9HYPH|nr:recombination mediator RecR [Ahrensia marina]KPB00545.1 recombinase RecR [Ahrensia marina]